MKRRSRKYSRRKRSYRAPKALRPRVRRMRTPSLRDMISPPSQNILKFGGRRL